MRAPLRTAGISKTGGLWLYWLVVAIAYALTLVVDDTSTQLRVNFQNVVFDQYQRWRPRELGPEPPVRTLDIDDELIRRLGQWPWPRQTMARMVEALTRAHAAAVCFDVLFSEKDRAIPEALRPAQSDGDAAFAGAIARQPVVLGEFIAKARLEGAIPAKSTFAFLGADPTGAVPRLSGVLAPLPALVQSAAGLGFLNWQADADRVVRRVPLLIAVDGQLQPSFAIESLRVAQGASTYIVKSSGAVAGASFGPGSGVEAIKVGDLVVPTQGDGAIHAYFGATDPLLSIPAWKVLEDHADLSDLAGKIVVVGANASLLSDIVATPINPSMPGVEAQAQLIEQILAGVELLRPDWAPGAELLAFTALSIALVVATPMMSALWSALLGAFAVAAMSGASWLAFTRYGLLLDPVAPSLFSGAVFLAGVLALYGQKRRQLSEIRSAFRTVCLARRRRATGRAPGATYGSAACSAR